MTVSESFARISPASSSTQSCAALLKLAGAVWDPNAGLREVSVELQGLAMRHTFLSFSPPLLGDEEIAEVVDTLRSDWITTGPKVKRFEREFADLLGTPAALAVSS